MARRTMAERKRRATDRDARRESLLVLLSRVQREVPIAPVEASLLRAHVEVEISESDELRRTVAGQQNEIQRQGAQLEAAHEAIQEAEQERERIRTEYEQLLGRWRDTEQAAADYREQLRMYRAVEEQRQVTRRATAAGKQLAAMEADRNKWRKYGIKEAQRLDQLRRDAVAAVPVPAEVFADLVKVVAHVSCGRMYAFHGSGPYPDAAARRALAVLDDAGLLDHSHPPVAPTCRPGPYDDCPNCRPEQQPKARKA
ncbi:hypothetical protein [Streptomyces sp. NPDC058394]|uniref:hypothetical protein n=1 Tax=Streptomyces sp. NPDC058394 TaxID=3346477 RepID=UPI0036480D7A